MGVLAGAILTIIISAFVVGDKDNERVVERELCEHTDNRNICSRNIDKFDSDVGDIHGKINSGQDMGFSEMDTEEVVDVLSTLHIGSCRKEREVLDFVIRLVKKLEEIFMGKDKSQE